MNIRIPLHRESFTRKNDSRSGGTTRRTILSSKDPAARWWMRVSAGVREDKDPTDSLPACATCISLRRSRCAQIRAESVAAHCRALLVARNEEILENGRGRMRTDAREGSRRLTGGWKKWRWGWEWRRWYGGELAMNDRNQRNTASRKLLPSSFRIHPEYIIHTGVPWRGASSSLGQGVAYSGTDMAPEEEKRAREEPHDRPYSTVLHHEARELRLYLSKPLRDLSSSCPIPVECN